MEREVNIRIGEEIRSYLESKDLQQHDVAERVGISQSAVSAYYRGKPFGKKAAKKWEDAFGFRSTWLILGEGEMLVGQQNQSEVPAEPKPVANNPLIEYLQRKIAELESKVDKLTDEKADLLQENAVLKYENLMLASKEGKNVEDAAASLSANAG